MDILIKRGASTILTVQPQQASTYMRAIMGEETVTIVWEQSTFTALQVGDYITYNGIKHTLNQLPVVKKLSSKHFQYNAIFQSPLYELLKANYMLFDNTATPPQGEFSLTGNPDTFITLLVANLNRVSGSTTWIKGTVISADVQTLTFSNESCFAVLQKLATTFKTEYSVSSGHVNLIETSYISNLTLEYGSTLYDIERNTVDSSSVITRLYPFGSTRNIAANYRGGSKRLLLPGTTQFLESNVSLYGVIEGQKTFDDIYPRLGATSAGTVTSVYDDGCKFTDSNLDFNINSYIMPGTPAKVHFLTGQCAGYDLEIASFTDSTKTFIVNQNKDDKGFAIPNGILFPAVGDKYQLLDVIMPDSYISDAENELMDTAVDYLSNNSQPKVSYTVTFAYVYAKINASDIKPGDWVTVRDSDIGINTQLRVIKVQKGVVDPWNIKIDLSDTVSQSTLNRFAADIAANTEGITAVETSVSQQFSRNWRDVQELSGMINTLRADMLFIGNVQGQFSLSGCLFTPNYQNDKNRFYATAGSLIHKTIPSETTPGTWILPAYAPIFTGDSTPYYFYAQCSRTSETGVYYLSPTPIVYDSISGWYYFLIGILSSVNNGVRTLQTTYGFTQITGKQLVTGTMQSADGSTYFNLDTGEIGGNIKFKSGSTYKEVGAALSDVQSNLQSQIDGEITSWFYDYEPNLTNIPAVNWSPDAVRDTHLGDLFYWISKGYAYRYQKVGGIYSWSLIKDTDVTLALANAATATTIANGKRTTFVNQPTTPYLVGDLWLNNGDLFSCNTACSSGSFNSSDWGKGVKYTDDTAVNNLQIGGRNLIKDSNNFTHFVLNLMSLGSTDNVNPYGINNATLVNLHSGSYDAYWVKDGLIIGKKYTISLWVKLGTATNFVLTFGDGNSWNTWGGQKQITGSDWQRISSSFTTTSSSVYIHIGGNPAPITQSNGSAYIYGLQLEEGTKSTDYTPAPEDVQAQIDASNMLLADISSDNKLTPNEKQSALKEWQSIQYERSDILDQADYNGIDDGYEELANYTNSYSALSIYITPLLDSMTTTSDIDGATFRTKFNNYYSCKSVLLKEISNVISSAAATAASIAASIEYLKDALAGSTEISGGLVGTNVLLLKALSGAITGGMSGLSNDNVGFWTGGTYQNAIDSIAKIILRKDGSGQLAGGGITWNNDGTIVEIVGKITAAMGKFGFFDISNNLIAASNISLSNNSLEDLTSIGGSILNISLGSNNSQDVSHSSNIKSTASASVINIILNKQSKLNFHVDAQLEEGSSIGGIITVKNSLNAIAYSRIFNSSISENVSINLSADTYRIDISATVEADKNSHISEVSVDILGENSGSYITATPQTSLTKIANNGFYSYWGTDKYLYLRLDYGFEVRFGSYIFQVTSTNGIRKSSNGGSSWTSL